jgi:hypothetical protein
MADGDCGTIVPTALYRHFDADDKLLYVGISLSPTYRLSQHGDCSPWFGRIARITIEWFDSRDAAMAAERQAIKAEKPECNVVHNRADARAAYLEELAAESCAELTRKVTRFSPSYVPSQAATAVGLTEPSIRLAMQAGELPYYPAGDKAVAISGWALIAFMEALQAGVIRVRTNKGNATPPMNNQALVALWNERT